MVIQIKLPFSSPFILFSIGFLSEVDYIKGVIGSGFVILGPITKGFYSNSHNMIGLVDDYEKLDEAVGTMDDFRHVLKQFHEKDLKVVLTFDFNSVSINHKWIKENRIKPKVFENSLRNQVTFLFWFDFLIALYLHEDIKIWKTTQCRYPWSEVLFRIRITECRPRFD